MNALERLAAIDPLTDAECRWVLRWLAMAASPGTAEAAAVMSGLGALADYRAHIARLRASAQPQSR